MKKSIKATVEQLKVVTVTGNTWELRCKIIEGPDAFLDRRVMVQLNPKDVELIVQTYKGVKTT